MVRYVRSGYSYRAAARRWQVSVGTVARWVHRASGAALGRVDWRDRKRGPLEGSGRTPAQVVKAIVRARYYLRTHDALGEYGPAAIRRRLLEQGVAAPCERTIARWLQRRGLSGQERWRRPPPPKGWYLPEVAAGIAELDSCDIVEGLCLRGRRQVEAFNVVALWGGSVDTTTAAVITSAQAISGLRARWERTGCPQFLQCDNDTVFTGAHAQRPYLGRLVHWCLCLGVVPVFTPPAELGFQAAIEAYNRRWQDRVWRRWRHRHYDALRRRSDAFATAYTARVRLQRAEPLTRLPWSEPTLHPRVHRIVLLRRLDASGSVVLCAQRLHVAAQWAHRLVRCDLDVQRQRVRIHALRRRDPRLQPILRECPLHIDLVPWHRPST